MAGKKIVIVSTVPMMIFFFLRNHITNLVNNYQVTILTNTEDLKKIDISLPSEVVIKHIPFQRKINLILDFYTFLSLLRYFFYNKADIVYSISPKAGLLSMLAAKIMCIPIRINNFTGQQWVIKKGLMRYLIKCIDKITAKLASINLIDGESQRQFLIKQSIVNERNSKVILNGSICGVDLNRFYPNEENKIKTRNELKIPIDSKVFIYLGRINKDKGILEISKCLIKLLKNKINITFLIVGPEEDSTLIESKKLFKNHRNNLKIISFTHTPEKYFQASDIFCTLSNKEGFGNSVIEAGACGLPAIGSDIYGLRDSIIHNETGYLVNREKSSEIEYFFNKLASNEDLITRLGNNARQRSNNLFDQNKITQEFMNILNRL